MKAGKLILRLIGGLVVGIIVLVLVAWLMIDSLAAAGVEKGASYALGVDTSVEGMSVSLLGGGVKMSGMRVANPEGFDSEHLFRMGRFDLGVKLGSLLSDTIEVQRFIVDGLDVHVEQKLSGSNVGQILSNLKRFDTGDEPPPAETDGKKVRVDRIEIRNVTARFHLLADVAATGPVNVQLDEIVLTDVTSDDAGGVVIGELVSRLVPAILTAILKKAEDIVPGDLLNDLGSRVTVLTETLGPQARQLTQQIHEQAGKQLDEALAAPAKTVGGLLEGVLGPDANAPK